MATLTIRNLPDSLVDRLKASAEAHGRSMEHEVRESLAERYPPKAEVIERIRARWEHLPEITADEVQAWRDEGRP